MSARVYLQHPTRDDSIGIRVGYSWPAFLLGPLWALSKGLWFVGTLMTLVAFLCEILTDGVPPLGIFLTLVASAIYGSRGNEWYVWTMKKRGWQLL
ncbi:DUF2628 domain-containing protein [Burkholderia ubonensis]|uniref:DUF2628 domain-containing protein n=1 Tax=Burkholderia ubonensis TaxID=101571 RepID=UPI0009B2E943|nr:DUF2628 domain-containing protein [Burkholderia ubonensis]